MVSQSTMTKATNRWESSSLQIQWFNIQWWWSRDRKLEQQVESLTSWTRSRKQREQGTNVMSLQTLKPGFIGILLSARPNFLNFPKQHCQLETKYSNAQDIGDYFSFKLSKLYSPCMLKKSFCRYRSWYLSSFSDITVLSEPRDT